MSAAVAHVIENLRVHGALKGNDVANIMSVSPATVSRWASGKATPDIHTQTIMASLRYVVDRLSDFYTPGEIRLWLHAPHAMLQGERAIDLINLGRSEAVLAVIEGIDNGAYT